MDQFAAWFGYAVIALSVADGLLAKFKAYAESTEGKNDDEWAARLQLALDYAHELVKVGSLLKGKAK